MRRHRDSLTPDLFSVPRPAAPIPASMDFRVQLTALVSHVLHLAAQAGKDRYQVAAEMSRLTGKEVSKYMLDAYSSEAREEFNLPFYLVPALETVCDTHLITDWLVEVRGGRLLIGRESLDAERGRLEKVRDEAARKIREIKRMTGEAE